MPEGLARFLLKHRWIIKPGLESTDPFTASERYVETLAEHGISIKGKRVLVFGYGGRFAVGVDLLQRGASYVVLCDHFASLDSERNRELMPKYSQYLNLEQDEVQPRSEYITLLHGNILEESIQKQITIVDVILSTSVFEHLEDVEGITKALANLTKPDGVNLHFIDLRDHYFKYPFEMLKFPESFWRNFLNPTSNLNRYRLSDYKNVFETKFSNVKVEVLERLVEEFRKVQTQIQTEFKTDDESIDAVSLIYILARQPQ